VIWSYSRASALSKAGETAVDVIGYAAQIAAHIIGNPRNIGVQAGEAARLRSVNGW
jgi:hypothetical protein